MPAFPLAKRKADKAIGLENLTSRGIGCGKFGCQFHIVFQDETGIQSLIDNRLPGLSMRQKTRNFVGTELEWIAGFVRRPPIDTADRLHIERTPVDGVHYFRLYGQLSNEFFNLRLPVGGALQVDDKALTALCRPSFTVMSGRVSFMVLIYLGAHKSSRNFAGQTGFQPGSTISASVRHKSA